MQASRKPSHQKNRESPRCAKRRHGSTILARLLTTLSRKMNFPARRDPQQQEEDRREHGGADDDQREPVRVRPQVLPGAAQGLPDVERRHVAATRVEPEPAAAATAGQPRQPRREADHQPLAEVERVEEDPLHPRPGPPERGHVEDVHRPSALIAVPAYVVSRASLHDPRPGAAPGPQIAPAPAPDRRARSRPCRRNPLPARERFRPPAYAAPISSCSPDLEPLLEPVRPAAGRWKGVE